MLFIYFNNDRNERRFEKMKKIFLIFIMSALLLGSAFAASISGMVVSLQENQLKSFSLNNQNYNVQLQKQDGKINVDVNGQKVEDVKEGDVVVIDGAEFKVNNIRTPWLFGNKAKVQFEIQQSNGENYQQIYKHEFVDKLDSPYEIYAKEEIDNYIEKYDIDKEKFLVYRESTNGELTPGKIGIIPRAAIEFNENEMIIKDPYLAFRSIFWCFFYTVTLGGEDCVCHWTSYGSGGCACGEANPFQ